MISLLFKFQSCAHIFIKFSFSVSHFLMAENRDKQFRIKFYPHPPQKQLMDVTLPNLMSNYKDSLSVRNLVTYSLSQNYR